MNHGHAALAGAPASPQSAPTGSRVVSKDSDLCSWSLVDLAEAIRRRELSPVELTTAYLDRIDRLDGTLHSFVTLAADGALDEARQAEREIASGHNRGPLHGIPIGLKDIVDTAGVRTTAGSMACQTRVPSVDATVVAKLRRAGAVVIGKLETWEFALGEPSLDDQIPPPRNPWDLERVPGGSSSGSAAAVAAGLCSAAIGTDTGGSIRHPSAMCGVVGLKPTYGRVSFRGIIPLAWSFDHAGPIGQTVRDVALVLREISGFDPDDPASVDAPAVDPTALVDRGIEGIRIGVPWRVLDTVSWLQPDVRARFVEAIAVLRDLGASIGEIELPMYDHSEAIFRTISRSDIAAFHFAAPASQREQYGVGLRQRLLLGLFVSGADNALARRGRARLTGQYRELMRSFDLIATPTMPTTARRWDEAGGPAMAFDFTQFANVTGQPGITVPCGFDSRGLPVGLMLCGRHWAEDQVVQVAHAYEQAAGWHRLRPVLGEGE